ncbi:hypothetical protein [Thermoflexus sp.]|uniref:hypothetical protein n=1 Tax=Thermoflexus sp. TaxID=1969742 RepID=UPI0035E440A7
MSALRVQEIREQGFPALRLENGPLTLTLIPELGGKIAGWEDRRRGLSWLWRNPYLPWRLPQAEARYVQEFDLGGWDECLPAIAPGAYPADPWTGVPIPDHGELWFQPWKIQIRIEEGKHLIATGVAEGRSFPYRFERTLILEADRPAVRIRYRLQNKAEHPFYFLWAAHPLFPLLPGMRLLIPEPATARVAAAIGVAPQAMVFPWPQLPVEGGFLDLREPDSEGGWALKLFLRPAASWARLIHPTGAWWEIGWRGPITHLGLWINAGGWSGANTPPYQNLALEPAIGAPDDLGVAMREWGFFGLLPPLQEMEWSLQVTVG